MDRFNQIAAEWDADPRRAATAAAVARAMLTALTPTGNEALFEFGCGTGLVTLTLAPYVSHILAMDSASGMLDALKHKLGQRNIANVDTLLGDLPEHPPAGPFDLIVSSMTLHHIGDTSALLRVLFRLLRRGGRIALADLDAEDGSFHGDKPGVAHRGFDRAELTRWITAAGFTEVHFSTAHRLKKATDNGTTHAFQIFLVTARA